VLIDDSYNANPDSVRAAIDLLAEAAPPRVLIIGDMGEVGDQGPQFHQEIGAYARERGIEVLLALGDATPATVAAFGPGGQHFDAIDALIAAARTAATPKATLLIKGSRFMRMERVVAALTGHTSQGAH
jgi:UDP-N-acetylmuramoyl-tripeptide--D-alanyl-D-alanine ligase